MAAAVLTAALLAVIRQGAAEPAELSLPTPAERLDARQRLARRELLRCVEAETWEGREIEDDVSWGAPGGPERAVFRAAACFAWLVARSSRRGVLAVELYAGHGHLTRGLASGLARGRAGSCGSARGGPRHTLVTFEGNPDAIPHVLAEVAPYRHAWLKADAPHGLPGRLRHALLEAQPSAAGDQGGCAENESAVEVAVLLGSAYPPGLCAHACGRAGGEHWRSDEIRTCFKCPAPEPGQSALRELCEELLGAEGRLDLVLLDTASPGLEEWYVLERHCRPRNVLLVNGRLPMHQGWVGDRLLQVPDSPWREVHAGLTEWSSVPWPGMMELLRFSSFRLLADLAAEPPLVSSEAQGLR